MILWYLSLFLLLPIHDSVPAIDDLTEDDIRGVEDSIIDSEIDTTEEEVLVEDEVVEEIASITPSPPPKVEPQSETVSVVPQLTSIYTNSGKINEHHPEFLYELGPGINLAGAEFAPNDPNYVHIYPTSSIPYYSSKGFRLIRLPILWERLQPELYGDLSQIELAQLEEFLTEAVRQNMYVIIDLHNYDRYRGSLIGSTDVPVDAFKDVWEKLATQFKDHKGVVAYGIMNEPHDTGDTWWPAAQSAVDSIRSVDSTTLILVAGDRWSSAWGWSNNNPNLTINDPMRRTLFEAHIYFDQNNEGKYNCNYDSCGASISMIDNRMSSFLSWLDENEAYGFIGEFGVPSDDSRWNDLMRYFLNKLAENRIGATAWAGGPNWGSYVISIEPTFGGSGEFIDKPLVTLMGNYLNRCRRINTGESALDCLVPTPKEGVLN